MPAVLSTLAQSRKAWIALAALVAVVVLAMTHLIEPTKALDGILTVVSVWMGTIAVEDAAKKTVPGPRPPQLPPDDDAPPPAAPTVAAAVSPARVPPLLSLVLEAA